MNKGYNKGDIYEDRIHRILLEKSLTTLGRAGGGSGADIKVNNKVKNIINIEVKSAGADYGQKYLEYNDGWYWSKPDPVTDLYDKMGIIDQINPSFIPKNSNHEKLPKKEWSHIRQELITQVEKDFDQQNFEKRNIELSLKPLFEYYSGKNCFYIQIDGSGFYHLAEDKFNLGTKQYDGIIQLRLRAKSIRTRSYTINGMKITTKGKFDNIRKHDHLAKNQYKIDNTPWNYRFLAVMKQKKPPTQSLYCIEESMGMKFPKFD
jgi:hypothetical protein